LLVEAEFLPEVPCALEHSEAGANGANLCGRLEDVNCDVVAILSQGHCERKATDAASTVPDTF
jgi:hypothetical protein